MYMYIYIYICRTYVGLFRAPRLEKMIPTRKPRFLAQSPYITGGFEHVPGFKHNENNNNNLKKQNLKSKDSKENNNDEKTSIHNFELT